MRPALTEEEIASFRLRLCAVAERLFVEHGVEGVTMRQIAERLECSAMTPYRYFRNKDDLMRFVLSRIVEPFFDGIEATSESSLPATAKWLPAMP